MYKSSKSRLLEILAISEYIIGRSFFSLWLFLIYVCSEWFPSRVSGIVVLLLFGLILSTLATSRRTWKALTSSVRRQADQTSTPKKKIRWKRP